MNFIWYSVLFYSRSAWQVFNPNKAETVRAFFYLLWTFSCVFCYCPGSRRSRHRSLQVAGLQVLSQGGLGQPHPIKSVLDLRLPVQLWHNHSPHKCWNANQKNQGAPFYFLTSTWNRNTLTCFFFFLMLLLSWYFHVEKIVCHSLQQPCSQSLRAGFSPAALFWGVATQLHQKQGLFDNGSEQPFSSLEEHNSNSSHCLLCSFHALSLLGTEIIKTSFRR